MTNHDDALHRERLVIPYDLMDEESQAIYNDGRNSRDEEVADLEYTEAKLRDSLIIASKSIERRGEYVKKLRADVARSQEQLRGAHLISDAQQAEYMKLRGDYLNLEEDWS